MPPRILRNILAKLKGRGDKNLTRIQRRRALADLAWRTYPRLQLLLFAIGYAWLLTIPSTLHGQRTYIDENALQPGQVNTYWNWADVHRADRYLEQLESMRDRNASSHETATFISNEFRKLGIPASTQDYAFSTTSGTVSGTNAYAVLSSPRASGTEAMVISASRLSLTGEGDGTLNLRGIATVLSLAAYLKGYSLWAKDLVFVVSDGYLDGMQAWISSYHGVTQGNLVAEPLQLSSGVIWTALNIDYPGHSFSHLGVFFEGLNGRLPNQDLINSFQVISRFTGGVPVLVYDHFDQSEFPDRVPDFVPKWLPQGMRRNEATQEYAYRAQNVMRHIGYQARGRASGVHGLLHQFRIDAITLFAVPAQGPHGFHAIGRVVESTLRTLNNLLERLHASFFFYLLVGPATFMKIGAFLPAPVLVGTAMLVGGMGAWAAARWARQGRAQGQAEKREEGRDVPAARWIERPRPVAPALSVIVYTHALGIALFCLCTWPGILAGGNIVATLLFASVALAAGGGSLLARAPAGSTQAPSWMILKSFNLCLASTVISVTSVLNFSLAATLAVFMGLPLSLSAPSRSAAARLTKFTLYALLALGWLLFVPGEAAQALRNWEVLRVWFAPFVCIVYTPLVLQAGVVCLLSP
ncbi:Gaa1-domain-containing protein [Phanerochaete sordida]|uniref:Gaa1-domain-containing protein n=1 Tax=Phanerochaete sordida TaxID=48140 RepID=A0A9P3G7J0_9APHY|nr:Gaa1-domain-containing protein [Phanerochaete sordida]